jgi:hypothetical protein
VFGGFYHALRLDKAEGQLLVVEVRNGMFFSLEDLSALLEEVIARQQDLSPIVAGVREIIALLDDGEYSVDGNAVAPTSQRLGNVVAEAEAELLRPRRVRRTRNAGAS